MSRLNRGAVPACDELRDKAHGFHRDELRRARTLAFEHRVVAPDFPGPGYAIALHGDMVVHRANALSEMCERISMVNGYVALDTTRDVQSRSADLIGIDDPETLYTEWARYSAWRARGRLDTLIEEHDFTSDVGEITAALETAITDVKQTLAEMRAGAVAAAHYER